MTSTNDGKEVKSNQTSAPKGKAYFIELYQSLDSRLNEAANGRERTAHLCEAWRKVHSLCLHSTASTHLHLLNWLQRHTAKTVLQTGWQELKHRDERADLAEAINVLIVECRTSEPRGAPGPPWEAQLIARGEWFKAVQDCPWEHPVLLGLLNRGETPPSNDEVIEWLSQERAATFLVRVQTLMANKANDIAMTLATAVMERVRGDAAPLPAGDASEKQRESPGFGERLRDEAGFTEELMAVLVDLEFVLLHKLDSSRCIAVAKQTPFQGLYKFLERLQSRSETSPLEKKLWKNSKEVAVLIAQVVMARCMMVPVCGGEVRFALYACARLVARLVARPRLPPAMAALAAPAPTAAHLHTLALAVDKQLEEQNETSMKPFVCELYVRAITSGMNELERLKLDAQKDKEARSMEQTLASWFVRLGAVLAASARLRAECELTAFSAHPSPLMYARIKATPALPPIQMMESVESTTPEMNSEFGSWASDSHSQTNFVKTSETLNMKKQSQANVLSTAIVNEGEALGLSPELCQDITTLLSGPRVKTLSWEMDRELLLENCRTYLDRTHGGTKAVTTELRYLNLNPADFKDLPEEEDGENDLYYGIEKGYEHLVEFQPEEFVASYDYDETETAYSSEEYVEKPLRKKKTKKPALVDKPESDEDDPLSNVAENKRKEKKERPHSKERSKKKDTDPLDIEGKEKKDKPKKERKKKEKISKPEGTLASLIGLKVAKTNKKVPKIKQSIGNAPDNKEKAMDTNVIFDGLYSMEDLKSPGNQIQSLDSTRLQNIESHCRSRKQTFHQPSSVSSICIASPSSYKSLSPSDHSRNNSPTSASNVVINSLTKLLETRRQKTVERKLPNAIIRPDCSMKLDSNFSPKGVDIPELPISYIDKQQIQNSAIESPVIQYAGKRPNKPPKDLSQSYFNFANQYLQERMKPNRCLSTPPSADKFLESVNLVSIYDKGPSCSQDQFDKYSNESPDKSKSGVNHHGFTKISTPNTYHQYPISKQSEKVIRPFSRVDPINPEHKTQSAKQMPQKKPDGNLNTFSRLSYFKNKQTDRSKLLDVPQTVGQKLDDFIWDNLQKVTNARDNPTTANMLGAPVISPPRPTLSEKDQNDLVHLLRQQDALNRHNLPLPQADLGFSIPSTSKMISTVIPPNHMSLSTNQMRKPDQPHKSKINIISTSIIKPTNNPKPTNSENPPCKSRSKKPKSQEKMPEWKNVMDAISKHKTPSRGPNALDMALKNSSFEKAFEESLRRSPIFFIENKNTNDISSMGPHQQEFAVFAKSTPDYLINDPIPIAKNNDNTLAKSTKEHSFKTINKDAKKNSNSLSILKKSAAVSGEVISHTENKYLLQSTKAPLEPRKYSKAKKIYDTSMVQKTAEQVEVERKIKNLVKNNKIEIISKNKPNVISTPETTEKLHKVLNNTVLDMQKQLMGQNCLSPKISKQTAVDLKKESKLVTGQKMPQIIKQYLNKEPTLGDLIPGKQNSEYDQLDELIDDDLRKEMDELSSDEEDYITTAQSLLNNTKTNEKRVNAVYNQPVNDVVYSHPLNNTVKTSHLINLRPLFKKNNIQQSMMPVLQQRLIKKPTNIRQNREIHKKPTSLNPTNAHTVITQSPPVAQALNHDKNDSHSTLAEQNVNQTSPRSDHVQNSIIISPNRACNGYSTIQTPVQTPIITQNTYIDANNAPNVNIYHANQYAVPVLSPVIIASAVALPVVNVTSVTASQPTQIPTGIPSQYSYVNSELYKPTHSTNKGNTDQKIHDTNSMPFVSNEIPKFKEPIVCESDDTNKSGERKVLKEVQEKYAGDIVDEKRWSQKVSEKHKTQADLERVKKKRLFILNRQISHCCGFQTIPLGYSPLHFPKVDKKERDGADSKSTSDDLPAHNNLLELNSEVKSPATPDSYKENKDESTHVRRILLRSSNKLKSNLFQNSTIDKKSKGSQSVSSETPNEILSNVEQSDKETKNKRRVSKRIRNKIVVPKDTSISNDESRKLTHKPKKPETEIRSCNVDKPKLSNDSETDQFFDVEAALLGSTIPKIIPVNLFGPDTHNKSESNVTASNTEIMTVYNGSLPVQMNTSKDPREDNIQSNGYDAKSSIEASVVSKISEEVIYPANLPKDASQFTLVPTKTTVVQVTPIVEPTTETDSKILPIPAGDLKSNQLGHSLDKINDITFEANHGSSNNEKEPTKQVIGSEINAADVKPISEAPSKSILKVTEKGNDKFDETPSNTNTFTSETNMHSAECIKLSKEDETVEKYIQSDTITNEKSKISTIENELDTKAIEGEKYETTIVIDKQKSKGEYAVAETISKPNTGAVNEKDYGSEVIKREKYVNSIQKTSEKSLPKSLKPVPVSEIIKINAPKNKKEDSRPGLNVSQTHDNMSPTTEQSVGKNNAFQITNIEKDLDKSHTTDSHQVQPSDLQVEDGDDDIQIIDEVPSIKPLPVQNKFMSNKISIESISNAENGDPFKKTVKIIANGRVFKGTVSGAVDINSLFDNPEILALLMKQFQQSKTLYSLKLSVDNNTVVSSNIEGKTLRQNKRDSKTETPLETVSLLSDDEEETCQELVTEFGKYKINSISHDILIKHQNKFNQKCYVSVKNLILGKHDVKQSSECREKKLKRTKNRNFKDTLQKVCNTETISIENQSGLVSNDKLNETKSLPAIPDLVQGIFSDFENILVSENKPTKEQVVLIDDSSNDSLKVNISEPAGKIDALKDMLLKELGVINNSIKNDDRVNEAIDLTDDNIIESVKCKTQFNSKITDIMNRKCFVKLIRCDHKEEKINRPSTDISQSKENVTIEPMKLHEEDKEIDDIAFPPLSRSSSLSILDVIEDIPAVNSRITGTDLHRSSPVMEVYDLIAYMEEKISKYSNMIKHNDIEIHVGLRCDSEWRATKEVEHLQHKNSIAENLVSDKIPNLATLILTYILKEDLVNRYYHVNNHLSSNSLKRKSELLSAPVAKVSKLEKLPELYKDKNQTTTSNMSATNVLNVANNLKDLLGRNDLQPEDITPDLSDNDDIADLSATSDTIFKSINAHDDEQTIFESDDITPDFSDIDTDVILSNNNTASLKKQISLQTFESELLKLNYDEKNKDDSAAGIRQQLSTDALVAPLGIHEDNFIKHTKENVSLKTNEVKSSMIHNNIFDNILLGCSSTFIDKKEAEKPFAVTDLHPTLPDQVVTKDDFKLKALGDNVNDVTFPQKICSMKTEKENCEHDNNITIDKMKTKNECFVNNLSSGEDIFSDTLCLQYDRKSPGSHKLNDTDTILNITGTTEDINNDSTVTKTVQETDQTKVTLVTLVCDKNSVETIDTMTNVMHSRLPQVSNVAQLLSKTLKRNCSMVQHHQDNNTLLESNALLNENVYETDQIEKPSICDKNKLTNNIQMQDKRVDSSDYAISKTLSDENYKVKINVPPNEDLVEACMETQKYKNQDVIAEKRHSLDRNEVSECFIPCIRSTQVITNKTQETDLYVKSKTDEHYKVKINVPPNEDIVKACMETKYENQNVISEKIQSLDRNKVSEYFIPCKIRTQEKTIKTKETDLYVNLHHSANERSSKHSKLHVKEVFKTLLEVQNKDIIENTNSSKTKFGDVEISFMNAPINDKNLACELNLSEHIIQRQELEQELTKSSIKPQQTDDILCAMNKMFGESENIHLIKPCEKTSSGKKISILLGSPQTTDEITNNLQKILEGSESVNVVQEFMQEDDLDISPSELATVSYDGKLSNNNSNISAINVLEDSVCKIAKSKTSEENNSDKPLSILSVDSTQNTDGISNDLRKKIDKLKSVKVIEELMQKDDLDISPSEIPKVCVDDTLSNNNGDCNIGEINVSEVKVCSESINENDNNVLPNDISTVCDSDKPSSQSGDCNIDGINLSLRQGLSASDNFFSGSVVKEVVDICSDEIIKDIASSTSENIDINTVESNKIEILTGYEYLVPEVKTIYFVNKVSEIIAKNDDSYDENLQLIVPKHTYASDKNTFIIQSQRPSRSLKRKKDMSDIKTTEKKYRKGKNIDYPKITAAAIAELAYAKEYKRIIDYCSTVKFSYSLPFHIEHIDVGNMLKAWPIQKQLAVENKAISQDQGLLYTETDDNEYDMALTDPLNQTLNEEILNGGNINYYKSIEINENNFNMGFGERSGRVIQKIGTGITKLSAATLSDVKHYQPFLMFDVSNVKQNLAYATQKAKLSQLTQLIHLKQKVQSYFKKTAIELVEESLHDKKWSADDRELTNFPFGLTSTEFMEVSTSESIVNVVQVGQLPAGAAAQNPVTCDPRVTHVSDASPQCSDNSPSDSQATVETEYTELTTANITLPVQQYSQQHESPKSQEQNSPGYNNDANSAQTLSIVKIELMEEETSQENDAYENVFSPLPTNNDDYSFEDTSNNMFNPNKTSNNIYNATDIVSDSTLTNIFNSGANMDNSYTNLDNTSSNIDSTYTNMDNGNGSTSCYNAPTNMINPSNQIGSSVQMDDASPNLDNTFKNINENTSTNSNNTYNSLYNSMGNNSNVNISINVSCNNGSNNNANNSINFENRSNMNPSPDMDHTNTENTYNYSYENINDYTENLENNNYDGNDEHFKNDLASNVGSYPSNVDNYATSNENYTSNLHRFATTVENYTSSDEKNILSTSSHINQKNRDNSSTTTKIEDPQPQDLSMGNSTKESHIKNFVTKENDTSKPDQLANAMNAAGISPESVITSRAGELVNLINQTAQSTANNIAKSTPINVMTLQQALAQVLPPPLNQTGSSENTLSNNPVAQQVLHFVQGPNNSQTVTNKANGTHLLHIVQNKNNLAGNGLSLVDAGLQQGGNQLIHIVNNGSQNNAQFLKRVNLLTNLTNAHGSNEQKMIQLVCKSADGKSIQLNAGHQRSMVLRLHPTAVQTPIKPSEPQDLSASTGNSNTANNQDTSQEIKSRSVYEENYAQFIQNSSPVAETSISPNSEKSTSLPKFNQVFGKQSYQESQNEINNGMQENSEAPQDQKSSSLEQPAETNNPPLPVRNAQPETTHAQSNPAQPIKQTISPMNIHTTMHGGVIYTRQIPVNISGGQTINLITVPSTELVDSAQKQQTDGTFTNQEGETSIIKLVPHQVPNNGNPTPEENNTQSGTSSETNAAPQPPPHPVLTQMRIRLPMLSKGPHIVPGARLVRPSFFQIQRNVIPGTNPPVYQQLVLTTAPSLGQTIRLPTQGQSQQAASPQAQPPQVQPLLVQTPQHTPTPHIPVQQVQHAPSTLIHSATPTPLSHSAPARNKNSEPESELSTLTLEQLREFDMVLEQVKERSVQPPPSATPATKPASADSTDGPTLSTTSVSESTQQVIYSVEKDQPANVVSYVNRKSTITSATTSFVRSPDSSGIVDNPSSSTVQITHTVTKSTTSEAGSSAVTQPKKKKKKKPSSSSSALASLGSPSKTNSLKPQEDEQTTQRILYILAEYKEQVENSPDKHKPAPRRRNQFPPTTGSKRKRSHCSSRSLCRREGAESPVHGENGEDSLITLGSEDSSCGTTFSECTDCQESHSPEDSPTKIVRRLTFEQETTTQITQTRTVPQRNVIVGDGQTMTVARTTTATAAAAKPTTTVLMPANYLLPVSMIKGGQQIAIMTNRGPKILVGAGESNAGALLFQRLIGPGLKPVIARPGVRHIRLPATALHNLQTFNIQTTPVTGAHVPDSSAAPVPTPAPPDLVDTRAMTSPWQDRGVQDKPDRGPSPDCTEPWNMPSSSIADDYGYEEIVRTDNMERTVLDAIPDRYSPDVEAQRIFDKMFDDSKKSMYDSPQCGYDIDTSDGDDKPYHQVVQQRKDGRHHRVTHVSTAALRHKYAILEHELRLQKSLSEECEDLGVDSPSASDLFPEADILFGAPSPAHEQTIDQCNTPPPISMPQSIPQPDLEEQAASDRLLTPEARPEELDLSLDEVGEIVTVGEDGVATIPSINVEEFARSHPNTTFHTEPEDGEITPFTIAQTLKGRHITFHSNRVPGTVVMAPQTTVISQATINNGGNNTVKFTDIDNMINSIPCPQVQVKVKESLNPAPRLAKFEAKDPGTSSTVPPRALSKFDSLLAETKQQLSTARQAVHSTGHATQVIRRLRYDDKTNARTNSKFHFEEPRARSSICDEVKLRNDRAMVESMGDNASSPGQPELFWDSNNQDRHERKFNFSDSEKATKSTFDELLNDSSAYGPHTRLDSVIKAARPERAFERTSFEGISASGTVDDTRPLRTYPPKRAHAQHAQDTDRHSAHKPGSHHHEDRKTHHHDANKKRVEPPRCQEGDGRRRTGRGVVKRGCSCCNGPNAPPKKRSRPKKPSSSVPDFTPTT